MNTQNQISNNNNAIAKTQRQKLTEKNRSNNKKEINKYSTKQQRTHFIFNRVFHVYFFVCWALHVSYWRTPLKNNVKWINIEKKKKIQMKYKNTARRVHLKCAKEFSHSKKTLFCNADFSIGIILVFFGKAIHFLGFPFGMKMFVWQTQ